MIIFGLGNPGSRYRRTRHNAGYLLVERLAKQHKKRFRTLRGYKKALISTDQYTMLLIKPICFMNESGIAVQEVLSRQPDDFLVVIDDINLPLGRLRLRVKGSDGGHRGLRSIIEELGDSDFPRLRIGVGRSGEDPVDHVLSRFKRREKGVFNKILDHSIQGLQILARKGFAAAQNHMNSIDLSDDE